MGSLETILIRIKDPNKLDEILFYVATNRNENRRGYYRYRWIGFGIIEAHATLLDELTKKGYDVEKIEDALVYIQNRDYRKEWLTKLGEYFRKKRDKRIKVQ